MIFKNIAKSTIYFPKQQQVYTFIGCKGVPFCYNVMVALFVNLPLNLLSETPTRKSCGRYKGPGSYFSYTREGGLLERTTEKDYSRGLQ